MGDCVNSIYSTTYNGYAVTSHKGKMQLHHRLAYIWAHGLEIEAIAGKCILHSCDNRLCINPKHLRTGTPADNSRDMIDRGRYNGGTKTGLTTADIAVIRDKYLNSAIKQAELAAIYKVSGPTISAIVNRTGAYK